MLYQPVPLLVRRWLAALLALSLALLSHFGAVAVWHIYLVTFLSGAVGIFDSPARTALIQSPVVANKGGATCTLSNSFQHFYPTDCYQCHQGNFSAEHFWSRFCFAAPLGRPRPKWFAQHRGR